MSIKPWVARSGLASLAARMNEGKPASIAYIGGSITQGGPDGYRDLTTRWLTQRFPKAAITEVGAGIGGTASDLGAFRVNHDVLRHRPDLIFVEFAVNDQGRPQDSIIASMEGIARQALTQPYQPVVCFVYTISKAQLADYEHDGSPLTVQAHERVADHYGIPSVNMASPVAAAVRDGSLNWDDFAPDGAHPTPAGYALYGQTLTAALESLFSVPERQGNLPKPLSSQPIETGRIQPVSPSQVKPGWVYTPLVNRGGWNCFDGVLESSTPGSTVEIPFAGTTLGLFYSLGPETGDIDVAIDNEPFTTIRVFDPYAVNFWRPCYKVLRRDLAPGTHMVRLRVSDAAAPESKGHTTKLASLLIEA